MRKWGWDGLRWLPFGATCAGALAAFAAGRLPFGLVALALAAAAWVLWLAARGFWPQALLVALLASPVPLHLFWSIPAAEQLVERWTPGDGAVLRVSGVARAVQSIPAPGGRVTRLVLGQARLTRAAAPSSESAPETVTLAEVELRIAGRMSAWNTRRRDLVAGGRPQFTEREAGRLVIWLDAAQWHVDTPPIGDAEVLRERLAQRAGYYLPHRTLAVYLPVLLGMRETESPEGRRAARAFTRVGVAHLLSISGLHVGLLLVLLLVAGRTVRGVLLRGQGWVHGPLATRLVAALLIWSYIALIGIPVPAVRAAIMGTMVVAGQLWGTRTSPLYLLCITALGLLAFDPTQLYDLSFQLSFLAYAGLLLALALWERRPRAEERGTWPARLLGGALLNLLVTTWVTAVLWPLIAAVFERVSLLAFAGNLLLVPLMGSVVMPAGLAGLAASFAALGDPPGGPIERATFAVLGAVLDGWTALVEAIDGAGAALVFDYALDWHPHNWLLYYAAVLAVYFIVWRTLAPSR